MVLSLPLPYWMLGLLDVSVSQVSHLLNGDVVLTGNLHVAEGSFWNASMQSSWWASSTHAQGTVYIVGSTGMSYQKEKKSHCVKNLKKSDYKVKQGSMVLVHYFRPLQQQTSFVCTHACVCVCVYRHTYVCSEGHVGVCICIYIYIKTGICIYMHTLLVWHICGISILLLVQQQMYHTDNSWVGIESIYWQLEKWFVF